MFEAVKALDNYILQRMGRAEINAEFGVGPSSKKDFCKIIKTFPKTLDIVKDLCHNTFVANKIGE